MKLTSKECTIIDLLKEYDFFEPEWYLEHNEDVSISGMDPWLHFVRYGIYENRQSNPYFETIWYKDLYEIVKGLSKVGVNKIFQKPELGYLELHLTDHCNLNCKGCSHFSPIADKVYANLNQYEKDLRRLKQLLCNIRIIRFLGGEPLLHPDVASFIVLTREFFPKTEIRLVTNGILLPKADNTFFEACRKTKTTIIVSVYPPFKKDVTYYNALLNGEKVKFSIYEQDKFLVSLNLQGSTCPQNAFNHCRKNLNFYCPLLRDGYIYSCWQSALVHYFNKAFNQNIIADKGIDIHSPKTSGLSIIKSLNKPIETCRWCTDEYISFPWESSNKKIEEWDANTYV